MGPWNCTNKTKQKTEQNARKLEVPPRHSSAYPPTTTIPSLFTYPPTAAQPPPPSIMASGPNFSLQYMVFRDSDHYCSPITNTNDVALSDSVTQIRQLICTCEDLDFNSVTLWIVRFYNSITSSVIICLTLRNRHVILGRPGMY